MKGGLFVVAMLSVLIVAGCATPPRRPLPEAPPPRPAEPEPQSAPLPTLVTHTVEKGQTLWRIARAYGVEAAVLAEANGIDDPTRIEIGQVLVVPGATEPVEVAPAPPTVPISARMAWPLVGELLSHYGERRGGRPHRGLDIRGRSGEPVVAADRGRVVYSGAGMRGYGHTVIVEHDDGVETLYAHNSRLLVRVGDEVERGQTLALVGRSGNATTEHCHFEVRVADRAVDPLRYLEGR